MNHNQTSVAPPGSGGTGGTPHPLLSLGFRAFFLAAGVFAVFAMATWIAGFTLGLPLQSYYAPVTWHAHEMLYGYTAAVIAGFLLTAVRNWTSLPTASGNGLALLVLLWLLGRALPLLPWQLPSLAFALIDIAFLPALAANLMVPLLRSGQRRNLVLAPILVLMAIANIAVHAEQLGFSVATAKPGLQAGLYLVMLLMAVIGGRVIPFFTSRALPGSQPRQQRWLDGLALASLVVLAAAVVGGGPRALIGLIAAVSTVAHLLRLRGWYSHGIWSQHLLWVLHSAYLWLVVGLGLTALDAAALVPAGAATHAYTVGAIGVMTLGMMARVSLGHTGRALKPAPSIAVSFLLLNLAAVSRVLLPLLVPGLQLVWISVAGILWCLAYVVFVAVYAPILWGPRVDHHNT